MYVQYMVCLRMRLDKIRYPYMAVLCNSKSLISRDIPNEMLLIKPLHFRIRVLTWVSVWYLVVKVLNENKIMRSLLKIKLNPEQSSFVFFWKRDLFLISSTDTRVENETISFTISSKPSKTTYGLHLPFTFTYSNYIEQGGKFLFGLPRFQCLKLQL